VLIAIRVGADLQFKVAPQQHTYCYKGLLHRNQTQTDPDTMGTKSEELNFITDKIRKLRGKKSDPDL
jgi:hypothetical protein